MAEIAERHFIKVSKRRNREHELFRARITRTTYERQGRQEIEAVEKSARFPLSWCHVFLHRLRVVSIFFLDENIPLFSPPRYKIPRGNVSVFLNPFVPPPIPFPFAFVCIQSGYASERHFLPQNPRR